MRPASIAHLTWNLVLQEGKSQSIQLPSGILQIEQVCSNLFKLSLPPNIFNLNMKQILQNLIKNYLLDIVLFEPDLVVPVDTDLMNPLFGLQLNNRSTPWGAQHAIWKPIVRDYFARFFLIFVNQVYAPLAVPWSVVIWVLLVEFPPVAAWMHHNEAQLANC